MQKELERITASLNQVYRGAPWYGHGFVEKMETLDWRIVNITPTAHKTSVARLVKHVINWRIFLIEKLKGNAEFNIETDAPNDWTDINIESEEAWKALLQELDDTQEELIRLLDAETDDLLDRPVLGRSYNFSFLIEGIGLHDVYHLGQIGLIASQIKSGEK